MSYQAGEKDQRPWGWWEVTGVGDGFITKRFQVNPGHRLSDQRHQGRAEVWTVLCGQGEVELEDGHGKRTLTVRRGDQVIIPRLTWHRIKNVGKTKLVISEVQLGVCDEADIERRTDDYQRV